MLHSFLQEQSVLAEPAIVSLPKGRLFCNILFFMADRALDTLANIQRSYASNSAMSQTWSVRYRDMVHYLGMLLKKLKLVG